MSSIVISGDTSGAVTLTVPATAGTNTVTIPASTGTVMVSSNMPAFSAYQNSGQSISASTFTKITCNTKEWDTNSNYDNATNYRFTPTVAGYYQVNGVIGFTSSVRTNSVAAIYKNGSIYKTLSQIDANFYIVGGSSSVYLNGSTDYIEFYVFTNVSGTTSTGTDKTSFSATLIRSA